MDPAADHQDQTRVKPGRKPVKTPANSTWYKGKHLRNVKEEYKKTALIIRLIISTGIRTDELPEITVEVVKRGYLELTFNKNLRKVTLPDEISARLLQYANEQGITNGPVFLTVKGLPCGKNAMFQAFGKLAAAAGVEPERLTSDALRKYYHDKHVDAWGITAVQASMGYKAVNCYVEYDRQDEDTLLKNLDEMLGI